MPQPGEDRRALDRIRRTLGHSLMERLQGGDPLAPSGHPEAGRTAVDLGPRPGRAPPRAGRRRAGIRRRVRSGKATSGSRWRASELVSPSNHVEPDAAADLNTSTVTSIAKIARPAWAPDTPGTSNTRAARSPSRAQDNRSRAPGCRDLQRGAASFASGGQNRQVARVLTRISAPRTRSRRPGRSRRRGQHARTRSPGAPQPFGSDRNTAPSISGAWPAWRPGQVLALVGHALDQHLELAAAQGLQLLLARCCAGCAAARAGARSTSLAGTALVAASRRGCPPRASR